MTATLTPELKRRALDAAVKRQLAAQAAWRMDYTRCTECAGVGSARRLCPKHAVRPRCFMAW